MYGYGYGGPWMPSSWMFGGGLMSIVWIALIVLGVALAIHLFRRPGGTGSTSALDILKERYARGEIERDEFDRKKRELS